MLDNDSGGRCICSDRNAELDTVLAQIEELDQRSYQMATYGVERIEMGDSADTVIANANAVAQSIIDAAEEEDRSLDLSLWNNPSYLYDTDDDVFSDTEFADPIEGKEGDALYSAAAQICTAQIPECANEMSMLQLMYSQQIKSDCTAYENSLKQQKNSSQQKLYAAETALRDAALEQYQIANKYDLGQCTVEFKNCMINTGGCGDDFSGCASIAAFDATNTRTSLGADEDSTYEIEGEVTKIAIQKSTYDILLSKKPLCESVTKQCVAVADQVWDTFLREVAPQVKSAELIAEDNARQNCIGNISSCFQQACKDTMDPNDPDGSYDMCLTRPETMLNLCQVPLNACGISTTNAAEAENSPIWGFVLARLQSMRVNSCTTQVKECLQADDRCGSDYTQCIGLDTDTIIRMCPEDLLIGCQNYNGGSTDDPTGNPKEDFYTNLEPLVQGIILNVDNAMLTECQQALDEAMIKVCGDTEDCSNLTTDDNIGARSLEYKICEYSGNDKSMVINYNNCRPDVSQITDAELGLGDNDVKKFAGVLDGTIKWENIDFDDEGQITGYENDGSAGDNVSETQKEKIESELATLQNNINNAVAAIESDQRVKWCMDGREIETVRGGDERTVIGREGKNEGRFENLTDQVKTIIANAALKIAKENYYRQYDEYTEKMMEDYVTIAERTAEVAEENKLEARRNAAQLSCTGLAASSTLAFDSSGAAQTDFTGSKSVDNWNYKETVTSTFNRETLVCHRCTRTQNCSKPKRIRKVCKQWADPVENCVDIQF